MASAVGVMRLFVKKNFLRERVVIVGRAFQVNIEAYLFIGRHDSAKENSQDRKGKLHGGFLIEPWLRCSASCFYEEKKNLPISNLASHSHAPR